jgi:hypothetical protein
LSQKVTTDIGAFEVAFTEHCEVLTVPLSVAPLAGEFHATTGAACAARGIAATGIAAESATVTAALILRSA